MRRRDRSRINRANAARAHIGFWTDERVDILKRLWAQKEFAGDIATHIGDGCTRLMVIGKANRLGLQDRTCLRRLAQMRRYGIEISQEARAAT